ncbi:MAG: aspartate ammonia-lyase [Thermoplasmata archaeon]|nr:MAG: aspartate ammonia-lyase [Thermoplasmata archaeon]
MVRKERDSLGGMELPDDVYYGIQTVRAIMNFPVSGIMERKEFVEAYVLIKKAAAVTNMELKMLDKARGNAIVQAADEVLDGEFRNQFIVDVFQAGAGTSFNMNVNEVLANRALEILGKEKGDYEFLSPNDHVNMAQSTNDTFPTASHIACVTASGPLINAIDDLAKAFQKKGEEFMEVPKSGRTHLMDATPLTLGHEFNAYSSSLLNAKRRIKQRRDDLLEIPLGSTAVGTGVNAHPEYREKVVNEISKHTSFQFRPAKDSFEALQSRAQLASFSGSLRELSLELIRIANDLRLLGSGPTTGLAEIKLPPVQPGSSIMPGKVNPVMAECLNMVAFHVIGNDTTVGLAAQAGQIDLNVFTPVMIHNILESMDILSNYLPVFQKRCVEGIEADEVRCRAYLEKNPSMATLLSPKIGYLAAAELAKEALDKGVSVKELAVEKGIITEKEADEIFRLDYLIKSIY